MKLNYTLLTISLITLASMAKAQIKKGTILLGGSIEYSNSKEQSVPGAAKTKNNTFTIGPAIGRAIKDNFVIGVQLGYRHSILENSTDYKGNGYSGGVFLRQYWNVTSKFYAFGHVEAGYSWLKGKATVPGNATYSSRSKTQNIGVAVIPGIAYTVSKNIQLESTFLPLLSANYLKSSSDSKDQWSASSSTQTTYSVSGFLSNGQTFSLGVRFLL